MGLTRRLDEHGDRPALIFPGRTPITYRDLALRVTAVAAEFGPEKKLVAVAAEPTEHAVISYLAAMHGRHAVALIPPCNASALDDFVADYSPEIICRRVDARWRCRAETGKSCIPISRCCSVPPAAPARAGMNSLRADLSTSHCSTSRNACGKEARRSGDE
ncbi:hypothetical protein [Mesorhizobium sp. M0159]|uniref:hypothetical protein n=1 Tax=Mesorhizobium sp. M0159 TaxID=2956900 RepID=UPI003335C2A0